MIERLQRALKHIEELSPEAQEDIAEHIYAGKCPVAQKRSGRNAMTARGFPALC